MLAVIVIVVVALLVGYVVHRTEPENFRLSASLLKMLSFNIEVTGKKAKSADELPPGNDDKTPDA